jgi:hypothetical protein
MTHFCLSHTLPDGQSEFAAHSGASAQATDEQVWGPFDREQQIPVAQSKSEVQASVGGVAQALAHTEPLGFAQQMSVTHSAFVWHGLPTGSSGPATHAEPSQ